MIRRVAGKRLADRGDPRRGGAVARRAEQHPEAGQRQEERPAEVLGNGGCHGASLVGAAHGAQVAAVADQPPYGL